MREGFGSFRTVSHGEFTMEVGAAFRPSTRTGRLVETYRPREGFPGYHNLRRQAQAEIEARGIAAVVTPLLKEAFDAHEALLEAARLTADSGQKQIDDVVILRHLAATSALTEYLPPEDASSEEPQIFDESTLPADYRENGRRKGEPLVVPYLTDSAAWLLSSGALAGARSRGTVKSVKVIIGGKLKDAHEFLSLLKFRHEKTGREGEGH
jgi:hypothetical protein